MLNSISYNLAILLWFFSLLLIYGFSTLSTATTHSNITDLFALLAIKSQLHDPLGVTSSWNISIPICLWTGVSCGRQHQRVTALDLRNQNIGGKMSPFIGNLSFLRSIDLSNNSFNGDIPNEVGFLSRLEILVLSNNSFSGSIPVNISHCSNLIKFHAYRNNLHGEIPTEIGNLLKLERLVIGDNHLTGQLPASIGNLSALRILDIRVSNLSGTIPYTLGQLRSLFMLRLGANNFFGMVPPSIFNLSSLSFLLLPLNRFHGSLPQNIGYDLPNLEHLSLSGNNFSGSLPISLSNISNLIVFDLGDNHFTGKVLLEFTRFKNLTFLNLGKNNLGKGTRDDLHFLTSLVNCSKLESFGLYLNQFGGVLPKFIGNFSRTMIKIAMGGNQISGSIPGEIGSLANLIVIGLEENQLTGNIPHVIGKLKKLQILSLYENSLEGRIPASLGNLTLLSELTLSSNNLEGSIPPSLGNCQNLRWLNLSKNNLNGTLPHEILGITTLSVGLELSNNLLSGPFPSQLGNLKTLLVLDISRNKFSGEIPSTLGSCSSLEYLHMDENSFNGSIPSSLSSLKSIQVIDFSSNNLYGKIPKYLETLSFLKYLNLSYNHFEGEVPTKGVFSNKTGISLVGNEKLCGGFVELHLPSCHSKKSKIPLVKVVIPVITSSLILTAICFTVILTQKRKSAKKSSSMLHMEEQFPMVSYADLSKATDSFSSSNLIGQGSYGSVYKGILGENRKLVAVKVINLQQKGGSKSFISECEVLRTIRHKNLIRIVTVCSSIDPKGADFKALVYEYMENGNLEESLHKNMDQLEAGNLSLTQRLNIAIDVASAVEYLHHHCQTPIVHGDLKPCNVLLDHDMVAHVGDFGLSKFLLSEHPLSTALEIQSSSIGIRGTVGYIAPEYGMGTEVSMVGDVYSFGILLLEMFTAKKPTSSTFSDGLTLHEFAKNALPEGVMDVVDPSFLVEINNGIEDVENFEKHTRGIGGRIKECLIGVLRIGVVCSMESLTERMEMADVVSKLSAVREKFLARRT